MDRISSLSFIVIFILQCSSFSQVECLTGGELTKLKDFKFLVHIEFEDSGTNCTGSIYNASTIITAAHCVVDLSTMYYKTGRIKVIAGTHNLNDKNHPGIVRYVKSIFIHSTFQDVNQYYQHDMCLLQLAEDLDLSDSRLETVIVPTKKPDFLVMKLASFATSDGRMRQVEMTHSVECGGFKPHIQDYQFCTQINYENDNPIFVSKGDDGAPLIRNKRTIVGVLNNYEIKESPYGIFLMNVYQLVDVLSTYDRVFTWKKTANENGNFERTKDDVPFYHAWTQDEIDELIESESEEEY